MIVCVLVENGPYFYNSFLIECFSYIVENGHPTKQDTPSRSIIGAQAYVVLECGSLQQ